MWYWLFKYIFMGPLLALLGRPKVEGLEYVPQSGPAILASNHLAVADSFYLCLVVRRRITFLAKSEYFTGTGLKGWFQRWFYGTTGQVPIDRSDALPAPSLIFSNLLAKFRAIADLRRWLEADPKHIQADRHQL